MRKTLTLAKAQDVIEWLEADRHTPWDERVERDRPHADTHAASNLERVLSWWAQHAPQAHAATTGSQLEHLISRVRWAVTALGAVSGVVLCTAVTFYDGSAPINVLVVLGWLVILPLVFMGLSFLLPLASSHSFLGAINPGGWIGSILSRRPLSQGHWATREFFAQSAAHPARDKLIRWQLMVHSQQFGCAFSIAALITLLIKVSVSDLAFGWSTTLQVEAATIHGVLSGIALPWRALGSVFGNIFADAAPSIALVESSRYYRLDGGTVGLSAENLTRWWSFLTACLLFYGVGARTAAFFFARAKRRKAVEHMLFTHPEVHALLDRLNTPVIRTTSVEPETEHAAAAAPTAATPAARQAAVLSIRWNNAPEPAVSSDPSPAPIARHRIDAGGERPLDDDLATLSSLDTALLTPSASDNAASAGQVEVLTKAWEPPLLEFHDYISALRERIGNSKSIVVRPLDPNGAPAAPAEADVWRRSLAQLQDPGVYVA